MEAEALRAMLAGPAPVLCPGVYDAFSAALAAQAGFPALYLSGASIAYARLGGPDIGLVTMTEVADVLGRIRERVDLPIAVDADTGFGNALSVQRTVRVLERAGATAIQIEDQSFPKRCGHLRGKALVGTAEMVGKIKAACDARLDALVIARTDGIAVEGLERALDRAERYLAAGADILFVEAPEDLAQMAAIGARFGARVPLLANMVEGGRTPITALARLGELGFRMVIYPGGTMRAVAHALRGYFASLHATGSTVAQWDRMLDFDGLNAMLGTPGILQRGQAYDAANQDG